MLNVVVALVPPGICPVSHTPLSLVDVWSNPSSFFQVTIVPFFTVKDIGFSDFPAMITVFCGGVVEVDVLDEPELQDTPARMIREIKDS